MNSKRWGSETSRIRTTIMCALADGHWRTIRELIPPNTFDSERYYQQVRQLERRSLVRIERDGDGRLHVQVVYSPELYELDVLNTVTVPDDREDA